MPLSTPVFESEPGRPAGPEYCTAESFTGSRALQARFHAAIPGGSHTYAKGDDQFPEFMQPYLVRGRGCRVWDVDGNCFVEYGAGLRAVTLGHAYPAVVHAAQHALQQGANLGRPTLLELETAEEFLAFTGAGDMVKFAKNGSDANTAALRLARAATGRDLVAICQDQPFFATDDWFIGTTAMRAGVPQAVQDLTVGFRYNDLASAEALFATYPGQVAALVLEVEKDTPPAPGFLAGLRRLCDATGTVLIFDEIITGFRWHNGGAQAYHGIRPDLSTFGKAMGNGFAIAALTGRRELMELGGLHHERERVFLLSTTYGAELHALAAARAVMSVYAQEPVVEQLWSLGARLAAGLTRAIEAQGLAGYVGLHGRPCCLTFSTRDEQGQPSQAFRTLLLQEAMRRGLIIPSLIVNYSMTETVIDQTIDHLHEALGIYRRALTEGIDKHLEGRPVRPVFRRFN